MEAWAADGVGEISAGVGTELDASGLAVSPGFFDVHSHDDWAVLAHPEFPAKVMQGVTTDIVGNCGTGVALYGTAMEGGIYEKSDRAAIGEWEGFAGYLARVDEVSPEPERGRSERTTCTPATCGTKADIFSNRPPKPSV